MIVIQLIGRLGNCMFLFGLGLSLQKMYPDNQVLFYYSKTTPEDTKYICNKYLNNFKNDFFFKFIDNLPDNMHFYSNLSSREFKSLSEIPIKQNTFLCSFFFSKHFLDKNLCQQRLGCPDSIKKEITNFYGDISNLTSIHVRRGDYVNNSFFRCMNKEWYLKCTDQFPRDQKFIVTSDDLDWCKENLTGRDVVYADKKTENSEMVDIYIHSLCRDNIISASTFSWWGSYLNLNKNKKVYAPAQWMNENNDIFCFEEIIKID